MRERLEQLLQSGTYVMVYDSFESVPQSESLLPALFRLPGVRFLFTNRGSLPYLHAIKVSELGYEDSAALVQHELSVSGRMVTLDDSDMDLIYNVIGGVPLLLKFVAHQLGKWPLRRVLRDLQAGQISLYRYLFQSSWNQLADSARHLLRVAASNTIDYKLDGLQTLSGLDDSHLHEAINQLVNHSLLQVTGSIQNPTYRFYRALNLFLRFA